MGKGKSPTPNELKFIYEMIAEGSYDTDILAKYDEMKKHGRLGSLPYRTDIRFVRQRRKEYETAQKVLEGRLKAKSVPDLVLKHWEDLAQLANQFSNMWTRFLASGSVRQGYIVDVDSAAFEVLQLETYGLAQSLLTHLKAEFPEEFKSIDDWRKLLITPLPSGCFQKLGLVANRRTFEGTCDICDGWGQSQKMSNTGQ